MIEEFKHKKIIELVKSLDRLNLDDIVFYSKLWEGIKQIEKEGILDSKI